GHVDDPGERSLLLVRLGRLAGSESAAQGRRRLPVRTGYRGDVDPGAHEPQLADHDLVRLERDRIHVNAGPLGAQHLDAVRVAQVDRVGADLEEPAHLDAGDGEPSLDRLLRLLRAPDAEAPGTISGMQPDEP